MRTSLMAALNPSFEIECPRCGGALAYEDVLFAGLPILVESRCRGCGGAYLVDWPAGHALLHPTIIDVGSREVFFDGAEWYPRALERLLESRPDARAIPAAVRTRAPAHRTAIVVNCVDYVYGHCLLKLLSGLRVIHDADADVIVVAQKQVSWLLPATVHTVVELDLPLRGARSWLGGLDETMKGLLARYSSVQIAPTPSQPQLTADDLGLAAPHLTPSPFWEGNEPGAPQITLLLREDRLWGRRPSRLGLLGRALPPTGRLPKALAIRAQNHRFAKVVRHVRAAVPEVRVVAIGLGRTGRLPGSVLDLRKTRIDSSDELSWCGEYARSRVVLGVHGSHLLLPSALAGAVIDLLPSHKLPNIAQDLIIAGESESEPKLCLFRYRILPAHIDPKTVAETVVSIIRDADRHHLNMIRNREATGRDWPRPFLWSRLDGHASGGRSGRGPAVRLGGARGTEEAAEGVALRAGAGGHREGAEG